MQKRFGQFVGIVVTGIVVMGCDRDVVVAMPLGVFAGALAIFFVTLDGKRRALKAAA